MEMLKRLKTKVKILKKEITALYYAYKDPQTTICPKFLILITLGYVLSPIDLIPDFIPVLGYLDDLIIVPALIALSIRLIPREIMEKARLRAEQEPLKLKKNWISGIFFILIWVITLVAITRIIIFNLKY